MKAKSKVMTVRWEAGELAAMAKAAAGRGTRLTNLVRHWVRQGIAAERRQNQN